MGADKGKTLLQVTKGKPDPDAGIQVIMPWDKKRQRRVRALRFVGRCLRWPFRTGAGAASRYRLALAPWLVAGLVALGMAATQRTSHPTILGLILAVMVGLGAIGAVDLAKGEKAKRVAGTAVAAAAVWTAVAAVAGTDWRPVRLLALAMFLAGALPWWTHHSFDGIPKKLAATAGLMLTWQLRMKKVLPDVNIVPDSVRPIIVSGKTIGEEAEIEAGDDTEVTTSGMISKTEAATGRFKLPIGQLVIDAPEDGRADRARIFVFTVNPLREKQLWVGSDLDLSTGMSSLGPRMDGTLAQYVWCVPRYGAWHDMICGTTGAGKSTLIEMLLGTSRASNGAIVDWVIDPQAGQSCTEWVDQVDRFAGDAALGLVLLRRAVQVMYLRNAILAAWTWIDEKGRQRKGFPWFPWMDSRGPVMPLLVITVFEAHAVLAIPEARAVIEELGKMARKCGIKLRLETQVPLLDQLGGSTTIRDMVTSGNVVVFRTANRLTSQVALVGLPVDPSLIPKAFPGKGPIEDRITAGLGYVSGGDTSAMQFRAWVDMDTADTARAGRTHHLDSHSKPGAGEWPPTPAEVVAAATAITVAAVEEPEPAEQQAGGTIAERVQRILADGQPHLGNDVLNTIGKKSRTSVFNELKRLVAAGEVVKPSDGVYQMVKQKVGQP
jgi:energy-coupling factor transporter ATP-binding protein EcfA2